MTAKGKINASKVQPGDRIIVKVREDGTVSESSTKTGEGVQVARVIAKTFGLSGRGHGGYGRATRFYQITTSAGTFEAAPIQTMWLAPEDNAGIKRAWAEALIEDTNRAMIARELESQEAERAAGVVIPAAQEVDAQDVPGTAGITRLGRMFGQVFNPEAGASAPDANRHVTQTGGTEDLTLHSHDGKVDNMNNESATETQTAPADLGHRVEIDEAHRIPARNHTGSTVVALLERVWNLIREDHPELPEVVITTGSGEGTKWGHFRPESWKVRAEEGAAISSAGPGRRHELFLASEALAKGANQVLQTMLHEAGHTLSRVRNIKDTSRQGRWHNAQFRKAAEEMGLEHKGSAADKSHGFSFVTLTEATKERYKVILAELECELVLTGMLPFWLGGTGDEDERGGERITGKPKKTEGEGESKSGSAKAICDCEEPVIIRLSQKVMDLGVVRCDACKSLFHRP